MSESLRLTVVLVGGGGMILGLLSILLILTFAFPMVKNIEDRISGPERSIQSLRNAWGGGPIGRFMRTSYVFTFLVLREFPIHHFRRTAGRIGDPTISLPLGLRLWATVPSISMYSGGLVMLGCATYLG